MIRPAFVVPVRHPQVGIHLSHDIKVVKHFDIGKGFCRIGFDPRVHKVGDSDCRQYPNNGHNDKQFDEGERSNFHAGIHRFETVTMQ